MTSKNPFDNQDVTTYTIQTFGNNVRQRREYLGISVREMAKRVGMSTSYLSEIERGTRPAPSGVNSEIDYMSKLADELHLTASQKIAYDIMAKVSHMDKNREIDNYFLSNPNALKTLIYAIEENWTDEQWKDLYDSKK